MSARSKFASPYGFSPEREDHPSSHTASVRDWSLSLNQRGLPGFSESDIDAPHFSDSNSAGLRKSHSGSLSIHDHESRTSRSGALFNHVFEPTIFKNAHSRPSGSSGDNRPDSHEFLALHAENKELKRNVQDLQSRLTHSSCVFVLFILLYTLLTMS